MKNIILIAKCLTFSICLFSGLYINAQVGIGTTTPAAGSILDITSTDKGVLVPRVNITDLATLAPVTGGATDGLLVWSTNATNRGYHYWNVPTARWVPLLTGTTVGNDWTLDGNNIAAGNFLGTINGLDLNIRTTNAERMRVQANGQVTVGFGATPANAGDQFSAVGTFAVNGYSGTTGTGVYGQNDATGNGVWGLNSSSGIGVRGQTATGNGVFGFSLTSGIGVRGESNSNIASLGISTAGVGVQGQSTSSSGVIGFGEVYGTAGQITTATGIGAFGIATTSGRGVQGQSATGDGVLGFSGGAGDGVYGQSATGNGVYGYTNSNSDAVHAEQDGNGNAVDAVNFGNGVGVYGENFFFTNPSIYAVDGSVSLYAQHNFGGPAILAETDGGDAITSVTTGAAVNSVWGINIGAGTSILGGANNLSVLPGIPTGIAGSGTRSGISAYAGAGANLAANYGNAAGTFTLDTDANPTTNGTNNGTRAFAKIAGFDNLTPNGVLANATSYYGGYFSGGNVSGTGAVNIPSYAYAGIKYNSTNVAGTGGTNYKIIGNGTNSTIIRDKSNTPRILFSAEAPEILFEDYGTGKLVNGIAQISIDPILKEAIYVDEKHPLKVFIQLEGDCNGVFVTNKSANGFTVKELANGTSNVSFSYHLVANRADDIDASGQISSKHVGLRFPVGPEPLKETEFVLRKEGENTPIKDSSSKKRAERKERTMTKVDETMKAAEAIKHDEPQQEIKEVNEGEVKETNKEVTKKIGTLKGAGE